MSTFVFVHGSWHGGWCWYKVASRLKKAGHKVLAPDLPSLGRDRTPHSQVSLETWTRSVCRILDAQDEPVILVGHSRAGIIISQAAEQRPEKVKTLVYLTAFLLRDGESIFQVLQDDAVSLVRPNLVVSEDRTSATVREEAVEEVFYGECPEEDRALARSLLVPEPLAPIATPIRITEANFGRVPRVYIECRRDKALAPATQKKMYTALPCQRVMSIDTDHSSFLSAPDALTTHLLSL
jgi:pimeloyl-ACP methyl ester carboxylesterase